MNWIIIKSNHRGTTYGVGTYIEELSKCLSELAVNVYILDLTGKYDKFKIDHSSNGVNVIGVPFSYHNTFGEYEQHEINETISEIVEDVIGEGKLIVQCNFLFEHFLVKALKKKSEVTSVYVNHMAIKEPIAKLVDFSSFDHVICLSSFAKKSFETHYPSLSINPKIIKNGISVHSGTNLQEDEKLDIRKKYNIKDDDKIILYAGRIDYQKGIEFLIEAFKRLKNNCHLLLVGEGDFESVLPKCEYYHDRITFTGHLPREKVIQLYECADIGVNTTLNDNAPFTILEMMSMGLPVVASRVGGIVEQIKHKTTGYLVEMEQGKYDKVPRIDEITNCIQYLIDSSDTILKMGKASRQSIKEEFCALQMAKKYIKIIS